MPPAQVASVWAASVIDRVLQIGRENVVTACHDSVRKQEHPSVTGETGRLFRHDRLITWNTVRGTFAGRQDRAIAALMMLVALAVVRAWFADRSWTVAAWTALAAGMLIGVGVGRLVATRLAFHAFDGLLAADAMHCPTRRRYIATCYGVGLALLAAITAVARPSLLVASLPAYLAGVLVAGLTKGAMMPRLVGGRTRPGWTIRAWAHRPVAGLSAATILLLSLLPTSTLGTTVLTAIVGAETLGLALMLTNVDDAVVRFMTIAGHGWRSIVVRHIGGLTAFLVIAVPGCWIGFGPLAAGMVAAGGIATAMLLMLRVLAYQLHGRRFADLLVSVLAGLLMLVGYAMPVALPVVALVMLWQLRRRGKAKTWLLA